MLSSFIKLTQNKQYDTNLSIINHQYQNPHKFQSKSQSKIINTNAITNYSVIYSALSQFQLKNSRYANLKQYQFFIDQISKFNQQLKQRDSNRKQIPNIQSTYYFYHNLFTRIRHINNLSQSQQLATKSLISLIQWYIQLKPKIRGEKIKQKQPEIKQYNEISNQHQILQDLTQNSIRKRQMKPYQTMARTAHTSFFPPKQRLLDYNKKQFAKHNPFTDNFKQKRFSGSALSTNNQFFNKKASLGTTMTTLKAFKTQSDRKLNQDNNKQKLNSQFNIEINQFNIDELNFNQKQQQQNKLLNQQDNIKDLIQQPKFDQDDDDQPQQNLLQQNKKQQYKKVYERDYNHTNQQIQNTQQKIKDSQQSTLRRLLINKETQIKRKLQDLDIKSNINKWAKTRSFINQQIQRKSQSYRTMNNFHKTQFIKKGFFQKKKQIPQFQLKTSRSNKTQNFKSIQKSVENKKINDAMRMFGRYISSHVKIDPKNQQELQTESEIKRMIRTTSLTSFNKKNKKKQFGQIITANDIYTYNNGISDEVVHLKQKLSHKMIPLSNNKVFNGLNIVRAQVDQSLNIFPKNLGLLSNPFFPKHLYETKKKKKK